MTAVAVAQSSPPADGRKLLSRAEAAAYLDIKPQTLALWHSTGRYSLPVVKVGRSCKYRVSDLEAFIASRTVANSGEADRL